MPSPRVKFWPTVFLSFILLLGFSLLIGGCGGGGGGGNPVVPPPPAPTPLTFTGTVKAPGGQMAYYKPSLLQQLADLIVTPVSALTGISPVAGIQVTLVKIGNDGSTLQTYGTTTTNGGGQYSFTLPNGQFSSDLVVIAASGAAQMRAIVASSTADINPAMEVALRFVLQKTSAGTPLTNFTPAEVQKIQAVIDAATANIGGATVTAMINNASQAATADANVNNTVAATSNPAPTITGFSPTTASAGATVTITGTYFDATPANNTVTFSGNAAATVTAATTTQLTVTVPSGAKTGPITVSNDGGTVSTSTDFTVAQPPSATTNAATSVAATSATLNGAVNPNGYGTSYYFQWGTTTAYGNATNGTPVGAGTANVAASANLTGLTANTTYHYRVVAQNTNGTTRGADQSFTTAAATGKTMAITVIDRNSQPVQGAWVQLDNNTGGTVQTNGQGQATFSTTAGAHDVHVFADGYIWTSYYQANLSQLTIRVQPMNMTGGSVIQLSGTLANNAGFPAFILKTPGATYRGWPSSTGQGYSGTIGIYDQPVGVTVSGTLWALDGSESAQGNVFYRKVVDGLNLGARTFTTTGQNPFGASYTENLTFNNPKPATAALATITGVAPPRG